MHISTQLARRMQEDPFVFGRVLWPKTIFYGKQAKIIEALEWEADEVVVPAGNKLGKDYVGGFTMVEKTIRKGISNGCRVVTTSVTGDHLDVLWAEAHRFIQTSRIPLLVENGGPLKLKHMDIQRCYNTLASLVSRSFSPLGWDPISYCKGMVAAVGEKLSGHHAEYTLGIVDEASGVQDDVKVKMDGWAKKYLIIGNCWQPQGRFFQEAVEAGDVEKGQYTGV